MKASEFNVEQLKQLPLRAIVTFAVRCGRRVQPLAQFPEDHPRRERHREAVEAALRMAEELARGSNTPNVDSVVAEVDASRLVPGLPICTGEAAAAIAETAHAAASAWHLIQAEDAERGQPFELKTADARKFIGDLRLKTAELAALCAYTAAVEACDAVGYHNNELKEAALKDYDALLRLKLGCFPEAGAAINPAPDGPLGQW